MWPFSFSYWILQLEQPFMLVEEVWGGGGSKMKIAFYCFNKLTVGLLL